MVTKNHLLAERWMVGDPDTLPQVLNNLVAEHNRTVRE